MIRRTLSLLSHAVVWLGCATGSPAQNLTTLLNFGGANGKGPATGLMQATNVALALLPATLAAQQVAIGSYPSPSIDSEPIGITVGRDGASWFTELGANKIGRITT